MIDEVVVRITDLARGGAGVGRDSLGRVIFIPFSAPGDLVRAQLGVQKKRYAEGRLLEVLEASAERQTPRCPVFGSCGGCDWQHLSYSLQWRTKRLGVAESLKRVGVIAPHEIWEEIPAEEIWNYRNRVQLHGQGENLGFYKKSSKELVPTLTCDIAHPKINSVLKQTAHEGARLHRPYKVEIEVREGEVKKSWDAPHSALGFRQVHDSQNLKLQHWIQSQLGPQQGQHARPRLLYDLFGGAGNLSLAFCGQYQEIHCVDVSAPRVHPSGTPQGYFFHGDSALSWLQKRKSPPGTADAIIDPPREGLGRDLEKIAQRLIHLKTDRVIAVGCDADAWAKDISKWIQQGWILQKVLVLDLFPQTVHIESVALMRSSHLGL